VLPRLRETVHAAAIEFKLCDLIPHQDHLWLAFRTQSWLPLSPRACLHSQVGGLRFLTCTRIHARSANLGGTMARSFAMNSACVGNRGLSANWIKLYPLSSCFSVAVNA